RSGHFCETGRASLVLFTHHYCCLVSSRIPAGSSGRPHVSALGLDQDAGFGFFLFAIHHSGARFDATICTWTLTARVTESSSASHKGNLFAGVALVPPTLEDCRRHQSSLSSADHSFIFPARQSVHAGVV